MGSGFALRQIWPTVLGSPQDKLAEINAMTVATSTIDVALPQVAGYLLLNGVYPTVLTFAAGSLTGVSVHDNALIALKTLVAWMSIPNAPPIQFTNPVVNAQIVAFADAIMAQETASAGSTGFTQAIRDGLLALGQVVSPWWKANGFSGPVTIYDAANNGLVLGSVGMIGG